MVNDDNLPELVAHVRCILLEQFKAREVTEKVTGGRPGWFGLEIAFEFITEVSVQSKLTICRRDVWVRADLQATSGGLLELRISEDQPVRLEPNADAIAKLLFVEAWHDYDRAQRVQVA